MRSLAVFYHIKLSGGNPPVPEGHPTNILREQMRVLKTCGLAFAADQIFVGINQSKISNEERTMIPAKAEIVLHGDDANTECPTLHLLQEWAHSNPNYYVCYFHAKGARNNQEPFLQTWRECMQHHVIEHWGRCIDDMERTGVDSVGCHWLTPEAFGPAVREPFWGGNYWWCTTEQLLTLPKMPPNMTPDMDYYTGERWFGWGRRPRVIDYAPHWPNATECAISSKS